MYYLLSQSGMYWAGFYDGVKRKQSEALYFYTYADAMREREAIKGTGAFPLVSGWRVCEAALAAVKGE